MQPGATRAIFKDRVEGGRALAERLWEYAGRRDLVVLGLPRGGVPVAAEVAQRLNAPLDIWLVRKLGVPSHSEFAMGAIAGGGVVEIDEALVRELHIAPHAVREVVRSERAELERRERAYRRGKPPPYLEGKTVIVVDDGMATGSTMRAVVTSLRNFKPARIVVAVPVASSEACRDLGMHADECVCVACPDPFRAVGLFYENFGATSDEEVLECLDRFSNRKQADGAQPHRCQAAQS